MEMSRDGKGRGRGEMVKSAMKLGGGEAKMIESFKGGGHSHLPHLHHNYPSHILRELHFLPHQNDLHGLEFVGLTLPR